MSLSASVWLNGVCLVTCSAYNCAYYLTAEDSPSETLKKNMLLLKVNSRVD